MVEGFQRGLTFLVEVTFRMLGHLERLNSRNMMSMTMVVLVLPLREVPFAGNRRPLRKRMLHHPRKK
jgi:hypothetical protein